MFIKTSLTLGGEGTALSQGMALCAIISLEGKYSEKSAGCKVMKTRYERTEGRSVERLLQNWESIFGEECAQKRSA
jgi:hypothetical protein